MQIKSLLLLSILSFQLIVACSNPQKEEQYEYMLKKQSNVDMIFPDTIPAFNAGIDTWDYDNGSLWYLKDLDSNNGEILLIRYTFLITIGIYLNWKRRSQSSLFQGSF